MDDVHEAEHELYLGQELPDGMTWVPFPISLKTKPVPVVPAPNIGILRLYNGVGDGDGDADADADADAADQTVSATLFGQVLFGSDIFKHNQRVDQPAATKQHVFFLPTLGAHALCFSLNLLCQAVPKVCSLEIPEKMPAPALAYRTKAASKSQPIDIPSAPEAVFPRVSQEIDGQRTFRLHCYGIQRNITNVLTEAELVHVSTFLQKEGFTVAVPWLPIALDSHDRFLPTDPGLWTSITLPDDVTEGININNMLERVLYVARGTCPCDTTSNPPIIYATFDKTYMTDVFHAYEKLKNPACDAPSTAYSYATPPLDYAGSQLCKDFLTRSVLEPPLHSVYQYYTQLGGDASFEAITRVVSNSAPGQCEWFCPEFYNSIKPAEKRCRYDKTAYTISDGLLLAGIWSDVYWAAMPPIPSDTETTPEMIIRRIARERLTWLSRYRFFDLVRSVFVADASGLALPMLPPYGQYNLQDGYFYEDANGAFAFSMKPGEYDTYDGVSNYEIVRNVSVDIEEEIVCIRRTKGRGGRGFFYNIKKYDSTTHLPSLCGTLTSQDDAFIKVNEPSTHALYKLSEDGSEYVLASVIDYPTYNYSSDLFGERFWLKGASYRTHVLNDAEQALELDTRGSFTLVDDVLDIFEHYPHEFGYGVLVDDELPP